MAPLPESLRFELQLEYISTFSAKIQELQEAAKENDSKNMKNLLHKLAGSGQTYEMPEITKVARELEESLEKAVPTQEQLQLMCKMMTEVLITTQNNFSKN